MKIDKAPHCHHFWLKILIFYFIRVNYYHFVFQNIFFNVLPVFCFFFVDSTGVGGEINNRIFLFLGGWRRIFPDLEKRMGWDNLAGMIYLNENTFSHGIFFVSYSLGCFFFEKSSPAGKSSYFENFRKLRKTRLPWTSLFIIQNQARLYEMRNIFTHFLNSDFLEIPVIDNSCILFLD